MPETDDKAAVVIVGAGVAGLALGTFLLHNGLDCVILERRSRDYVEQRQRAGVIDTWAVRMFRKWGLEERVVGGAVIGAARKFRIDGEVRPLEFESRSHSDGRYCPQQVVVRNLIDVFVSDGGDLRFDSEVLAFENLDGEELPHVHYQDGSGAKRSISAEFVAGCDGDRGPSRAAIPSEAITRYAHEYGYAWLVILADIPPVDALMAVHPHGFSAQFPRGAHASRFYLQVPLDADESEWTDERIWDELETRLELPMDRGPIVDTQVVPLRSVVYDPMRYGRMYLLGDSAHIIPPMSAKGMNLALHDAEAFAQAVLHYENNDQDTSLLDHYSETCLRHVWNYQAFATWWTEMVHNAGDASYRGEFARQVARADLERMYESSTANRLLSEFISGLL